MTNLNSYIQLSTGEKIDLQDGVNFPFNMSIGEIQDISKRSGGYSKTLVAAGTANNRVIFGQLFKANVVDTSFDLNIRKKCFYVENGVTIFRGYLQLFKVNKISKNNIDGDGEVTFEVAIRDDAGDFYSVLNDKYLNDLDFSDMNHQFEWSAITATSAHTWENGYKYHQYQTSNSPYWKLSDFRPSIFAKQYFDRIFADAGYTYTWSDMDEILFDKMIIPYNADKPVLRQDIAEADLFKASYANATTGQTLALYTPINDIIFDDDSDADRGLFDNGGNYNTSTGVYSITNHNFNTLVCKFNYEVYFSAATNCTLVPSLFSTTPLSRNYLFKLRGTNSSHIFNFGDFTFSQFLVPEGTALTTGLNLKSSGTTQEFAWNSNGFGLQIDVLATIFDGTTYYNNLIWRDGSNNIVPVVPVIKIIADSGDTSTNYLRNSVTVTEVGQGQTIFMNDYIPQKIKQKDFIADVVKMFNLYITYDKEQNNHLIIKTRDNFYDEGDEMNISDLLDTEQDYSIQYLPDLQKKKLLFTYKEAKDVQSVKYKEGTNEIYGQYEYTFPSEFVRDTLIIGNSLFEETPLLPNIDRNVTSVIDGIAPKSGIKILYDGGWIDGNPWTIEYFSTNTATTTTTYSTYPYAGHLYPNPINPTHDLNWGLNDYLYYSSWDRLTLSNLYNKYYKRFVNQIENGKLLTGYFKLDEKFILNLDFSTKFYIHDCWWTLNKIIDYNGNGEQTLTKCEFISVDEGIKFNQQYTTAVIKSSEADWVNTTPRDLGAYNQIIGPLDGTVNVFGTSNSINSGVQFVDVKGSFNTVGDTKASTVIGTGNTIGGADNIMVIGDDNVANTKNALVVGSNIETSGLEGIYTDNLVLSSGGTIIIDGNVVISGGTFDFCTDGINTSSISGCSSGVPIELLTALVSSDITGRFDLGSSTAILTTDNGSFGESYFYMDSTDVYLNSTNTINLTSTSNYIISNETILKTTYDRYVGFPTGTYDGEVVFADNRTTHIGINNERLQTPVAISAGYAGILSGVTNSVIAGGVNITADTSNTLYAQNARLGENGGIIYSGGTPLQSIFTNGSNYLPITGGTITGDLTVNDTLEVLSGYTGGENANSFFKEYYVHANLTTSAATSIWAYDMVFDDSVYIKAEIIGRNTNNQSIGGDVKGVFEYNAFTLNPNQVGSQDKFINSDLAYGDFNFAINNGTDDIELRVNGDASLNTRWFAKITVVKTNQA